MRNKALKSAPLVRITKRANGLTVDFGLSPLVGRFGEYLNRRGPYRRSSCRGQIDSAPDGNMGTQSFL